MFGGGVMLLFGLLFMLLVVGLPLLLIAAVVIGVWGSASRRNGSVYPKPVVDQPVESTAHMIRSCTHCGQGLQAEWIHCPYCGATV